LYFEKQKMNNSDIKDPLFLEAVEYIDDGNYSRLQDLLEKNPSLSGNRLDLPDGGYFKNPYLLWFVADNPIRVGKLPSNIIEITKMLIQDVQNNASVSFQEQIDYTLGLVSTGRIPRESGAQIELMNLLLDAGAKPGNSHGALAHGNIDAARHLIERGGDLTLTTAICLNKTDDIVRLAPHSTSEDRQVALMAASYFGNSEMINFLITLGVNVSNYIDPSSGFHSHATALHQAVSSGSMESVKSLVEAGARLDAIDRTFDGTPQDWADYLRRDEKDEIKKKQFAEIETYLQCKKQENS
jgi:Ankyrin repeats (3 copies)